MSSSSLKRIRCAIYTRKSTEEGLDQEFNSLDAQYEACAAYVQSQKHEGWSICKERYDDGGISGGTMERPAFQRLLHDIDEGRVDQIIVYKIDRLTRSLTDFTKIVERLDAAEASFVSVTQSFNTATSMGRLTLNMLLSFAQFEREVTSERIRDKIAASKAKGMWMGGSVPLGYERNPDPNIKGLIVCETEARSVRTIFELYKQLGNLNALEDEAMTRGIVGKARKGKPAGYLSRGALHKILTNPFYLGKINHKGTLFEGRHGSLIEEAVWHDVQGRLKAASVKARGQGHLNPSAMPLKGKVFDETGDPFTPSHSHKNGRIHRYYLSNRLLKAKDPRGWRLPAKSLEAALANYLRQEAQNLVTKITEIEDASASTLTLAAHAHQQGQIVKLQNAPDLDLLALIERADISEKTAEIRVDPTRLANLCVEKKQAASKSNIDDKPSVRKDVANPIYLETPLQFKRRGIEQKLVIGTKIPEPDPVLIRLLKSAHDWLADLKSGKSLSDIAKQEGKSNTTVRKRIPLALLSPKIQKSILEGTQPINLTADQILRSNMPISWQDQEQLYEFVA